jgi:hypothetical protein
MTDELLSRVRHSPAAVTFSRTFPFFLFLPEFTRYLTGAQVEEPVPLIVANAVNLIGMSFAGATITFAAQCHNTLATN